MFLSKHYIYILIYSEKMASKRGVRSYFSAKINESKRSRISIPEIFITAIDIASQAEVEMSKEEVNKESTKKNRTKMYQKRSGRKLGDML